MENQIYIFARNMMKAWPKHIVHIEKCGGKDKKIMIEGDEYFLRGILTCK